MSSLVGYTIGRYQILEQIGTSAFITTYKAFDTRQECDVAFRVIHHPSQGITPDFSHRFEQIARRLEELNHAQLVRPLGHGQQDNILYQVTEYIVSANLTQRMGRPMPYQKAAWLIAPVARALAYVHKEGLIHQDIKPATILLNNIGRPVIARLGMADLFAVSQPGVPGGGLCSPEYTPPEQWTGKISPQTDIYALGVVFFEMVTGHKPFTGETPEVIRDKQLNQPLPDSKSYVPLPQNVENLILRAIAPNPADRFGDMSEFASSLEELYADAVSQAEAATVRVRLPVEDIPEASISRAEALARAGRPETKEKVSFLKALTRPRSLFFSLQAKILLGFCLVFILVFAGAFYWFNLFSTQMAMERISADMKNTLLTTAKGIDVEQFKALAKEGVRRADGYTDDPRYWEQVKWLVSMKSLEPRAKLYTYIKGDPNIVGQVKFITSGGAMYNSPFGAKFLGLYVPSNPPEIEPMWQGFERTFLDLNAYYDSFGYWVSAYTPLKDAKGEIVGALGIDFNANYVKEVEKSISDTMVYAFAVTFLVLFVLIFWASTALTRPMVILTRIARQISEGKYDTDLSFFNAGSFRDEISVLAQSFGVMVSKVYTREQTLIREVEELKIEIDVSKRQSQVSEIVESDFFQELRSKSDSIRKRRQTRIENRDATAKKED